MKRKILLEALKEAGAGQHLPVPHTVYHWTEEDAKTFGQFGLQQQAYKELAEEPEVLEPVKGSQQWERNVKVRNLMEQKGIPKGRPQKKALKAYGECFKTKRPTFDACQNWSRFKDFMTGYGKGFKRETQRPSF